MITSPTVLGSFGGAGFTGMSSNMQAMQAAQAAQMAGASRLSAVFAGLSGAGRTVTGGFIRLGASMASATAQMGILGAKGAMGLGRAIGAGGPLIGMGALAAGSAMGIDSNALTFGAMGLMMGGPIGAGVGAAAGFALDARSQQKNLDQQQKDYQAALEGGLPSDIMATGTAITNEAARVTDWRPLAMAGPTRLVWVASSVTPSPLARCSARPRWIWGVFSLVRT